MTSTGRTAPVVDAQVHLWPAADWSTGRAWDILRRVHGREATDADMARSLHAAGIGSAVVVVPSWSGWDNGYACAAAQRAPGVFAVVGRIDPLSGTYREQLRAWAGQPGGVGVRLTSKDPRDWAGERYAAFLRAAGDQDVPVCVYPGRANLARIGVLARSQGCRIVVDHLGLVAPPLAPVPTAAQLARDLTEVVALARHPNVTVKITGLPALSGGRYPFVDTWTVVHRLLDAFGPDRLMWGSDITRTRCYATHAEQVGFLREIPGLGETELDAICGATAARTFGLPVAAM